MPVKQRDSCLTALCWQRYGAGVVIVTKNVLLQVQLTLLMWWFYCTATMYSWSSSVCARGVVGYVNTLLCW